MAVVTQTKGTFESMEPALADTAPSLSVALKMRSCIVCTDRRPVPICASVAHRGGRSHDDVRSSKLLPRSPGHVTSSQLTAYACHIHIIMVSSKHGTFWRGSRAWIAGPRRFSMVPRTYLTSGGFQTVSSRYWLRANIKHDIYEHVMACAACRLANRQEEAAPESTARIYTRAEHPMKRNLAIQLAHTARAYHDTACISVWLHGRASFASCATPP
jgi:hypothetical protein